MLTQAVRGLVFFQEMRVPRVLNPIHSPSSWSAAWEPLLTGPPPHPEGQSPVVLKLGGIRQ